MNIKKFIEGYLWALIAFPGLILAFIDILEKWMKKQDGRSIDDVHK